MWNKFKSLPLSVRVSIAFLIGLFITITVIFPPVGIVVGIVLGTAGAIFRVFFYLAEGK
jgi:hypothetical protein